MGWVVMAALVAWPGLATLAMLLVVVVVLLLLLLLVMSSAVLGRWGWDMAWLLLPVLLAVA
jgi:hypothetical protein